MKKILFFVSEDWYFCSHRLDLAKDAIQNGFEVSLVTRVTNDADRIRNAGINLIPININRSQINVFSDIKILIELFKVIKEIEPDLMHNVAVKPVILGSFISVFFKKMHVINALGGLGFVFSSDNIKAKLLKPIVQFLFKLLLGMKSSHLIVQNKDDYQFFKDNILIAESNLSLLKGAGIDNKYYQPLPEPAGIFKATLLARMLVDKGVLEFVDAAKILKNKGVACELVLVGDPDPSNPASIDIAQLRKWDESKLITWKGFEPDIRSIWASSHLSVLPSYREGLPKSLLESAACGRAIVTTNVPGCREIVIDGVNGLLVTPKSGSELAVAIETLVKDETLRKSMAIAGRKLIDNELSSEIIHKKTIDLYKTIISI